VDRVDRLSAGGREVERGLLVGVELADEGAGKDEDISQR
jgi:hypothetical protein